MKAGERIRNKFLKIFGDIKVFKYPMFLLYDPGSYLVKGNEIREVINSVQAGDILIRGYKRYLDGYFIPGFFSHAGFFLGRTTPKEDLNEIQKASYIEGDQMAIHSMAEGVFMEDIINFCRCDYLIILRRSNNTEPGVNISETNVAYCNKAIQSLGKPYDFKFDFSTRHALSCTEYVFAIFDDIMEKYNVRIKKKKVLFTTKEMIIPDDFVTSKFDIVFSSKSIPKGKLQQIVKGNSK